MTLTLGSAAKAIDHRENGLVEAARAGDDRAFEQLYARYRQRIFSFILSRVHDHGRAEDIAQEVFISALRRLRESDGRIAFKPWIYEIAKNACIDEYRRGTRTREVPLETDGELITDRQSTLRTAPAPAVAIEGKQRLTDLTGAFGGLSESHHRLLVMREFEGLSYDEIGTRLGMTRPMVESSLFRARRKLTEEYEELASGRRCEQVQAAIEGGRLRSAGVLGLRDRRRFARHLSHCQACRHVALVAGVDQELVQPRRVAEKIAALLPFPIVRRLLLGQGSGMDPSGPVALGGRAAAAAAVLALAGAGAGAVHIVAPGGASGHHAPALHVLAAPDAVIPSSSATRTPVTLRHSVTRRTASHRGAARHHHVRLGSTHTTRLTHHGSSRRSATGGRSVTGSRPGQGTAATTDRTASSAPGSGSPLTRVPSALSGVTTAVSHTLGGATGSHGPTGSSRPIASLVGSNPLGAAAKTVTGIASTITSGATSVLSAVTGSPSSGDSGSSPAASSGGPSSSGASAPAGALSGATTAASGAVSTVTKPVAKVVSGLLGGH